MVQGGAVDCRPAQSLLNHEPSRTAGSVLPARLNCRSGQNRACPQDRETTEVPVHGEDVGTHSRPQAPDFVFQTCDLCRHARGPRRRRYILASLARIAMKMP